MSIILAMLLLVAIGLTALIAVTILVTVKPDGMLKHQTYKNSGYKKIIISTKY